MLLKIKSEKPDCYISDSYIEYACVREGHEDFYRRSSEAKHCLMYKKGDSRDSIRADPKDDCEMLIEVNEKLSGATYWKFRADLVILMVGMEARRRF